jgi:CRISPR-associated protein Cas5d
MTLAVKVWGELACFTRPEMKVERVTYPVPTPSAARGILEAIFWKPEFIWTIHSVTILRPISYISMVRNEITSRQSLIAARSGRAYFAEEDRAQRHTLALRDVAYIIQANISLRPHARDPAAKYQDQFRRRVQRGQCFQQPYLGCREFVASFGPPDSRDVPIPLTMDLGLMLYDLIYVDDLRGPVLYRHHSETGIGWQSARVQPSFFPARVTNGVLSVPSREEVLR